MTKFVLIVAAGTYGVIHYGVETIQFLVPALAG